MIEKIPSIHISVFIQCKNGGDITQKSLTTFLRVNNFSNFQIPVSRDSFDRRNSTIPTIEVDLITIHDGFDQFIKLIGTPSISFPRLILSKMLN